MECRLHPSSGTRARRVFQRRPQTRGSAKSDSFVFEYGLSGITRAWRAIPRLLFSSLYIGLDSTLSPLLPSLTPQSAIQTPVMPSYPHFQTQAISGPASLDSQTSPCIVAFKNKLKGKGKHNVLVGTSEGIHVLQPTVDKDHQCTW
jgi:hypothetical protein